MPLQRRKYQTTPPRHIQAPDFRFHHHPTSRLAFSHAAPHPSYPHNPHITITTTTMSLRPVLLRALRQTRPQPTIPALTRALHLTPALSKKAPKRNTTDHQSPKTSSPPSANKSTKDVGVLDLKAEIDGVATALKDIARGLQTQLQKLRSHARHEPAVIEGVMVNMQGEGQVRLGDLAHVVGNVGSGKSRGIGVVVYEQAVSFGSPSFFSRRGGLYDANGVLWW